MDIKQLFFSPKAAQFENNLNDESRIKLILFGSGGILFLISLYFLPVFYFFFMDLALYGISITTTVDSYRVLIHFACFGGILFFPILFLFLPYLLYHSKWWLKITLVILISAFFTVEHIVRDYRIQCTDSYNAVLAMKGQILPEEELFQKCGTPVFYKDYVPSKHWVYCNGDAIIAVYKIENGKVRIDEDIYPFLD